MTTIEIISEGEKALQREESLIKECLQKRIEEEDDSKVREQLDNASNIFNFLLIEYIQRKDMVFPTSLFREAVSTISDYGNLKRKEAELERYYSFDQGLKYRADKLTYAYNFNLSQELAKRLIWYFKEEEQTPDQEDTISYFLKDQNKIIPLRDFVLGRQGLRQEIDKDDLRLTTKKALLISLMNMTLVHHILKSTREVAISYHNQEDVSKTVPAIFLNLAIMISTHLDLAAQYDIPEEMLTPLQSITEIMKKTLLELPKIEEHPEIMEEADHVLEHAREISQKYNNKKEK